MAECDCLKNLDELRLKHEEGRIVSFLVVLVDEKGLFTWAHRPSALFYASASKEVARRLEDILRETEDMET